MARSKGGPDRLFEVETPPRPPAKPASRAVGAYVRGWNENRITRPGGAIIGQVSRAIKAAIDRGVAESVVIEAALMAGQRGWSAMGFERMLGDLEARHATFAAAEALTDMNRRGL